MSKKLAYKKLLEEFGIDIRNTLLEKIISIEEKDFVEPKMKVGEDSNHEFIDVMTRFEKQCFTLLHRFWLEGQDLTLKNDERKLNHRRETNRVNYKLVVDEASDKEVRVQQAFSDTIKICIEGSAELNQKDSRSKFNAVKGVLCETIKDRLNLSRGANVRYYLGVGYKIMSETGIADHPRIIGDVTIKELDEALTIKPIGEKNNSEDDGKSLITESICVLF